MDRWTELRTALAVARTGTVSGAAERLGIHRATVVRHVDAVEDAMGAPFFHRHRKGYVLTAAGEDLLVTLTAIDAQLDELAGRTRGRRLELAGELTITAMSLFTPIVLDLVQTCREVHPRLRLKYAVTDRVLRLDHGEAHVAIRVGRRPDHPDEVPQALPGLRSQLVAHPTYLSSLDFTPGTSPIDALEFVVDRDDGPSLGWLEGLLEAPSIALWTPDRNTTFDAIARGIGAGFCPAFIARRRGLVPLLHAEEQWTVNVWAVTHRAMHRSAKVRWLLSALKDSLGRELGATETT